MTNRVIAAVSRNGIIGINNDLCWKLSDDLRLFKQLTTGRIVLMGRKTFESMGCKPLPDRINVVLSNDGFTHPGVRVIRSLVEVVDLMQSGNVDVIGGNGMYKAAFSTGMIDECIITHVDASVGSINGHVVTFPFVMMSQFVPACTLHTQEANARNEYPFITVKYVRG